MIFIYIISVRTEAKHCCITIPSIPLLPCLHVPCYCIITYFVTLSFIIMSFAFFQQYYCSNHNYELWIMNCELILVFGGHEKSLETYY